MRNETPSPSPGRVPECGPSPSHRESLRHTLEQLVDQTVVIATLFATTTGTLVEVLRDYVAVIDTMGASVLIPITQIQSVTKG